MPLALACCASPRVEYRATPGGRNGAVVVEEGVPIPTRHASRAEMNGLPSGRRLSQRLQQTVQTVQTVQRLRRETAQGPPPAQSPPKPAPLAAVGRQHSVGDQLFQTIDADGDGIITAEELAAAGTQRGCPLWRGAGPPAPLQPPFRPPQPDHFDQLPIPFACDAMQVTYHFPS